MTKENLEILEFEEGEEEAQKTSQEEIRKFEMQLWDRNAEIEDLKNQLDNVNKIIEIALNYRINEIPNVSKELFLSKKAHLQFERNLLLEIKSKINSLSKGDAPKDDTQLNKGGVNKHGNN